MRLLPETECVAGTGQRLFDAAGPAHPRSPQVGRKVAEHSARQWLSQLEVDADLLSM
jgi:hypothetical protein